MVFVFVFVQVHIAEVDLLSIYTVTDTSNASVIEGLADSDSITGL